MMGWGQKDFSAVLVVACLVMLAVVCVVGSRMYDRMDAGSVISEPASKKTDSISDQSAAQSHSDQNEGYVVIKEWNVRFKPIAGLKDVIYVKKDGTVDEAMVFTTKELAGLSSRCTGTTPGFTVLGAIHKTDKNNPPAQYEKDLGLVGVYGYYYFGPQSTCSLNPAHDSILMETKRLFQESLSTWRAAE